MTRKLSCHFLDMLAEVTDPRKDKGNDNLLKKLAVEALEETLTKWVNTVIESRPDLTGCLNAVAIDGKTMRASKKSGAITMHLLSVVSHELGVTLTQQSVSDKANEIPISTEILKAFDVSGKVITTKSTV